MDSNGGMGCSWFGHGGDAFAALHGWLILIDAVLRGAHLELMFYEEKGSRPL